MSILMTLRVEGDVRSTEQLAGQDPDLFLHIVDKAKERGLISHHFYGNEKEILVVDEWPDAESFQAFFTESGEEIGKIMASAGVTAEPNISYYHHLETGDDVG